MLLTSAATAQVPRSPELNMHYHRAERAWRSGASVLEAKARVDRVLQELPDDTQALKLRAQVLLSMDRPAEALADARRAVELHPDDGEAHLILCEVARANGNRAVAERALDDAAERLLDDALVHVRLSWNAVQLGRMETAEAFARIALAQGAGVPAAYYQLARVFVLQKKHGEAVEILARGLRSGTLDFADVERDQVLMHVADHPSLAMFKRR
jgi:tetratricopeptide (TPR) repeat protein